jgi:hypothetical protein
MVGAVFGHAKREACHNPRSRWIFPRRVEGVSSGIDPAPRGEPVPVALSEAVEHLLKSQTQAPDRLRLLAQYCVEAFAREGLQGVGGGKATEVGIRGLGRQKNWDLAFVLAQKPRLLISLKSMLRNIPGSVPNRLDDLMGEAANVQQLSPELVIGYVIIMDVKEDSPHRSGGSWIDYFESNLGKIAIRKAPIWNQGLIEGAWVIRIEVANHRVR